MLVAEVLGVPASHIELKTKRLGGGFGGKESRFSVVLLPAAVAANKLDFLHFGVHYLSDL